MRQEITGQTAFYCLLGHPVGHSISPQMHNAAFAHHEIDARYLAFDIRGDLDKAIEGLKVMGVKGFNLTMPYKRDMLPLCDTLSPIARLCGAVNTVVNENGVLHGHMTDGYGFMRSAKAAGIDLIGKKVVQLGCGGAGAAFLCQAAMDGVREIALFNGHPRPELLRMVEQLNIETKCKVNFYPLSDQDTLYRELQDADLLVNTTPIGMGPDHLEETLIAHPERLPKELVVGDMIYEQKETRMLREAREQGLKTFNGMMMLLYQGAEAFRLWTGKEMPVDEIGARYFRK